jgi:hypothetical protein
VAKEEKEAGATKRTRLTLADRVAKVDEGIKFYEAKLAALRKKRATVIAREEKRASDALAAVASARALEQVPMPGVITPDEAKND